MQILLVGCGKMGSAILNGWLKNAKEIGIKNTSINVIDPKAKPINGVKFYKDISALPKNYNPDFVFLAIKPQEINEVIRKLAIFSKACFVSILAGTKIEKIKNGNKISVVRAMPNLPATIGQGITALFSSDKINKSSVEKLFTAIGQVLWLKKEEQLDAVTAISGSGPAYVFSFMQELIAVARKLGLEEKAAKQLVLTTFAGSIELAKQSKDALPQLIKNVASKGGTTEAALGIFNYNNMLSEIISMAVQKAHSRAKELSN